MKYKDVKDVSWFTGVFNILRISVIYHERKQAPLSPFTSLLLLLEEARMPVVSLSSLHRSLDVGRNS